MHTASATYTTVYNEQRPVGSALIDKHRSDNSYSSIATNLKGADVLCIALLNY